MHEEIRFVPYDKEEPKKEIVLDPQKCQEIVAHDKGEPRQCKNSKGHGPSGLYCFQHGLKK